MAQRNIYLFSINDAPGVIHVNPLHVSFFTPQIDFSKYDKLIITSKQATKALRNYDTKEYLSLPAIAISKQSAKSYEQLGGVVEAVGEGYGDSLEKLIQSYPKEIRWLYLRAREVASDFSITCKAAGYAIDEKIVYETRCNPALGEYEIDEDAILIFTSPSSVKCFLEYHSFHPTQDIIVIGKTTAKKIAPHLRLHVAKETSIEACLNLAKTLLF